MAFQNLPFQFLFWFSWRFGFFFPKDKTICNSFVKGFIRNVLVKPMVAEMIYAL